MNNPYSNTTEKEAYQAGREWIKKSTRWEKLDFMKETCSQDFYNNHLMYEMARFMGEKDFDKFFKQVAHHWDILTPPELEHQWNS